MRTINYEKILTNIDTMINTAEFDAERSAGKTKMNAQDLVYLDQLRKIVVAKMKPAAKPTPMKKEVN